MSNDASQKPCEDNEAKRLSRRIKKRLWIRRFRREHPEARKRKYEKLKADPKRYARYLATAKRWRKAHPDYQRLWAQSHPQSHSLARKAYVAAWKAAHPERQAEYARRWRKRRGMNVSGKKRLRHDESLQLMHGFAQPFSTRQFALHVGITCGGACNLFRTLAAAGKLYVVRQEGKVRLYQVRIL
jgi:hypothetical protein